MTRLEEVEAQLRASLMKARDEGVMLVLGRSMIMRGGRCVACCVLGSLFVQAPLDRHDFNAIVHKSAEELGGIFVWETRYIALGWDASDLGFDGRTVWWHLGARLREEFKPVVSTLLEEP